jgi:transposase-like protein/IS1 family transposase
MGQVPPGLLALVALGLALAVGLWCRRARVRRMGVPGAARRRRLWQPRTPDDCPACRAADAAPAHVAKPLVRPWSELKGRRGAPKRIATEGFACPSPGCPYYRITDSRVHALVGYGRHGTTAHIQDFRCQACGTKVSARRGTALYQLKTPPARIGEVVSALAEGLDVAAAARVFGHGESTVTRWLTRAGRHAARQHARLCRALRLPHVQLDEIRTRLRSRRRVLWLWLALDPLTKIVPALHLGPRTQASAHTVVHALRGQLVTGCVPVVTSDGLRLYYYALTAHFGQWVVEGRRRAWRVAGALVYGQVQKVYQRRRVVRVTPRLVAGLPGQLHAALRDLGLSGRINTAFVERLNLTIRQGVAALTRRTWATAQTAPGLLVRLEWWRGYYHFVRPHEGLRVALAAQRCPGAWHHRQRYRRRTPAMAAGITTCRWTVVEFLSVPDPHAT